MRWSVAAAGLALSAHTTASAAQGFTDDRVFPGASVASTSGAESTRVNPAGVTAARASSLRLVHVESMGTADTALSATSVMWSTPLPFGFGIGLGASWVRPGGVDPATRAPNGDVGSADVTLGYSIDRRLSVGLRVRLFVGTGDTARQVDGAAGVDLGALYRLSPYAAFGLTLRGLATPRNEALGLDRTGVLGVAVRPFGSDVFTLGIDGGYTQSGSVIARGAARLAVPHLGYLRGEWVNDFQTEQWRASLGLEFHFGRWSLGGGGFLGTNGVAGFVAEAGYDGERTTWSLPTGHQLVRIPLDDAPDARVFAHLVARLERLRRDPTVRGILFTPRANVGGLAHAEELREVFASLKAAGVGVACHLTDASGSTWYACADADRITLDPAGGVRLQGLRVERYFLGPALWSFGVRTDFVRIGDWKSAPEQLTRGGSTGPAHAQEEQLLDDEVALMVAGVARARHMSPDDARAVILGGPYTARDARQRHVVDAIATEETAGRAYARALGNPSRVDWDDYVPLQPRRWATGRSVAVIFVDGDIVEGESNEIPVIGARMVGDRTLIPAIEAAAADPRVGAIVLRVDSPGGSALASDLLWRAVVLANRRKPVIASFGRIAASGGYYVGAAAREIFADPSTLTGSIGIFYGKADVVGLLDHFHVGIELIRRGDRADMESIFRPYSDEERRFLASRIGEFYGLFLQRVSTTRHRSAAEIDAVGQGHVWSGHRAMSIGLVDHEGGLRAAIRRAREMADLPDDADVLELPGERSGLLRQIAQLVTREGGGTPLDVVTSSPEVRAPMQWLTFVGAHAGEPLALTEWPMLEP